MWWTWPACPTPATAGRPSPAHRSRAPAGAAAPKILVVPSIPCMVPPPFSRADDVAVVVGAIPAFAQAQHLLDAGRDVLAVEPPQVGDAPPEGQVRGGHGAAPRLIVDDLVVLLAQVALVAGELHFQSLQGGDEMGGIGGAGLLRRLLEGPEGRVGGVGRRMRILAKAGLV